MVWTKVEMITEWLGNSGKTPFSVPDSKGKGLDKEGS